MKKIILAVAVSLLVPVVASAQQNVLDQQAPVQVASKSYLGDQSMKVANDAAAEVVKSRMAEERPADAKLLEEVSSAEIIVVSGSYDRVQDVLNAVDIKHTLLNPNQLDQVELNGQQLLIMNCGARPSKKGIDKIRKFVKAGGFLYTTDWALKHVVEPAFPGFIKWNRVKTQNDVVGVQVKRKDNVFLQHVKLSAEDPQWWLEASSYPIEIVTEHWVEVLIESKEMKKKYKESPIAVTFKYGDGRVLHIASHFYLQQNQMRTAADKKDGGSYIEEDTNLSEATKAKLRQNAKVTGTKGGNLKSAYSAQQMTTNIVVERKKDQKRIQKMYNKKLKDGVEKSGLKAGKNARVIDKKGDRLRVRTTSGDEAWVDEALVE